MCWPRFQGSREILITKALTLGAWMVESGLQGDGLTPQRVLSFFRTMTHENLESYTKNAALWKGSVSAGDIIYTPVGSLIAERAGPDMDNVGVKQCIIVQDGERALVSPAEPAHRIERCVCLCADLWAWLGGVWLVAG